MAKRSLARRRNLLYGLALVSLLTAVTAFPLLRSEGSEAATSTLPPTSPVAVAPPSTPLPSDPLPAQGGPLDYRYVPAVFQLEAGQGADSGERNTGGGGNGSGDHAATTFARSQTLALDGTTPDNNGDLSSPGGGLGDFRSFSGGLGGGGTDGRSGDADNGQKTGDKPDQGSGPTAGTDQKGGNDGSIPGLDDTPYVPDLTDATNPWTTNPPPRTVPEPSTLMLLLAGIISLVAARRLQSSR